MASTSCDVMMALMGVIPVVDGQVSFAFFDFKWYHCRRADRFDLSRYHVGQNADRNAELLWNETRSTSNTGRVYRRDQA